ncbi:hypothetical protein H1S04_16805 [Paracoccus sp. S1E-3]|nr:hypothetical protein [Paracoccus sp. S1E-3]
MIIPPAMTDRLIEIIRDIARTGLALRWRCPVMRTATPGRPADMLPSGTA